MNRRDFTLLLASPLLALGPISALPAFAAGQSHGLSTFGDLKYPADFKHFDYVNPDAPKGGEIRSWQLDTFDNFNPLILKGVVAAGADVMGGDSNNWLYDSLMSQSRDEPDALYALIAESVELGPDRGTVSFNLDSRARWQDRTPITSEDVIFTYTAVMKDGHPKFQLLFRDVAGVAAEGPRRVTFTLKPGNSRRDLPLQLARLPILSRAWFASREFNRTTLEPPLPSGPYKVEKV